MDLAEPEADCNPRRQRAARPRSRLAACLHDALLICTVAHQIRSPSESPFRHYHQRKPQCGFQSVDDCQAAFGDSLARCMADCDYACSTL